MQEEFLPVCKSASGFKESGHLAQTSDRSSGESTVRGGGEAGPKFGFNPTSKALILTSKVQTITCTQLKIQLDLAAAYIALCLSVCPSVCLMRVESNFLGHGAHSFPRSPMNSHWPHSLNQDV